MSSERKTLYLVDGSALIYRSYYAFIRNPLINSKGEDTSTAFGLVNSLVKLMREEQPDYLAIVFDTPHPTFRHKRYAEYKSTRAKMPEELVAQLPRVREVIEALNIPSLELPGFEADDIIGTLALQGEQQGMDIWCVTGDKDFFQLVTDRIKIYYPRRAGDEADRLGPKEVAEKFGVPPNLVIDKLALMGDSSDNIPGVPGVGPKTAEALLSQFGSFDAVFERSDEISAKGIRKKVAENVDLARLSHELVTIDTHVSLELEISQLVRRKINYDLTKALFLELEFNTLLRQLLPDEISDKQQAASPAQQADYHTVRSLDELKELITAYSKQKEIAVDTETTSLNPLEAKLVGVSLSDRPFSGHYIPLGHTAPDSANLPVDKSLALLKGLLENPKVKKVGQNIKYDLQVLHRCAIDIKPISFDTMLASYLIDPSVRQHSLSMLALKHFDYKMQPITDLIGRGKNQTTFDTVPIEKATHYAVEDADITFRLSQKLSPIVDVSDLHELYYKIELPLVQVLASMEEEGIRVDDIFLEKLSGEMESRLELLHEQIYDSAGQQFNINSTQQLSHILFEQLKLPKKGKTAKKTGYSTDIFVLEELAALHPLPGFILDYRQLTKLKNTYIDAIPRLISTVTGRVHTSFNQAVAATGRLSSTDPNLQNIPIRTEEGRQIRKAFVPRDADYLLLTADYSQIELRILAHYANDKHLIAAFKNGEDIHTQTASKVFSVPVDQVTPDMRRVAKTANFAIVYGVTAFGLSQQTNMSLDEAKSFIATYFEQYPGILNYIDRTKEKAREQGYVTTLFKRRRFVADVKSKNYNVRQFAERTAINTPIQGTAADIIKLAMIRIHKELAGMRSKMVLQVHDELIFDVHKDDLEKVRILVQNGMEKAAKLKVPLVVDIGVGCNWLEAK